MSFVMSPGQTSSILSLNGGTIDVAGAAFSIDAATTLASGTVSTLDLNGPGMSFASVVTGADTLHAAGPGTTNFGTLAATGAISLVDDGATLHVSGARPRAAFG